MSPSTPTPPRTSSTPQWSLSKGVSLSNRAFSLHWDSVHCRREMSPVTASHRLHRESPASTEPQASRFFQAWLAPKTIWFNVENCTIVRSSATQTDRRKPSKVATNFAKCYTRHGGRARVGTGWPQPLLRWLSTISRPFSANRGNWWIDQPPFAPPDQNKASVLCLNQKESANEKEGREKSLNANNYSPDFSPRLEKKNQPTIGSFKCSLTLEWPAEKQAVTCSV